METPNDVMIDIARKKIDKMTKILTDNGYTLYTDDYGGTLQKGDCVEMSFFGGYGFDMSKNFGWDRKFAARAEIVDQLERSFDINGAPWESESIRNEKTKRQEEHIDRRFRNASIRDSVLNFARSMSDKLFIVKCNSMLEETGAIHRVMVNNHPFNNGIHYTFPIRDMESDLCNVDAFELVYNRLKFPTRFSVTDYNLGYCISGFNDEDQLIAKAYFTINYREDADKFCSESYQRQFLEYSS